TSDVPRSVPARAISKRAHLHPSPDHGCTCERIVEVAGRGGFAGVDQPGGDVDGLIAWRVPRAGHRRV
ncbi:hypothetical protein FIBSPDRAFT_869085, partial [Athelia psychrophila]